jgi:predicted nucleotide-binding protein (sugar kinase/HSP70/actin superfamily)
MAKIGFPKALYYYLYYPFWQEFFTNLGHDMIVSSSTSKAILDLGVKETVNDACLPIKLFHGHVGDLASKVDVIFIPRMVSVRKFATETFCPKFLGLPDMVHTSMEDLPPVIEEKIDLSKSPLELWRVCQRIGKEFGHSQWQINNAYWHAKKVQHRFFKSMENGLTAEKAMTGEKKKYTKDKNNLKLAFLGYPYLVYDNFINVNSLELLEKMDVEIKTVEMVPAKKLLAQRKKLPKDLFWNFSNRVMHSCLYYLDDEKVDGIVHVTAFGCGPDAMVDKMMELESKNRGEVPFLTLSLDEHTGNAGVATRLEAFVDMLKIRREKQ